MTHPTWGTPLDLVEQQFNEVSAFVAEGNPDQIVVASAALQRMLVDFVQLRETLDPRVKVPPGVAARLQALAEGTRVLRTQMHRQAAMVEQSLKVIMPSGPEATYTGGSPYGSAMRQSGVFRVLAA
jgi:hypothetical protein